MSLLPLCVTDVNPYTYRDTDCKPGQGIYTAKAPGFKELVYGNDAFSSVMCAPDN